MASFSYYSRKIKKSPIVMVKNFILLECLGAIFFFISGSLIYYAKIYRSLPIAKVLSFSLAEIIILLMAEIVLVMYIFLRWHRESISIESGRLVHEKGVFFRKKTVVPFESVLTASFAKGPISKRIHCGTLILQGKEKKWSFSYIPDVEHHVASIMDHKKSIHSSQTFDLNEVVQNGEHERLEFKSSFRWDVKQGKVNKAMEKSTMKTVAAFMNSKGGHLILGVSDQGNVIGLDDDFKTLGKQNGDGFEIHFSHIFHGMIGSEFRQYLQLAWQKVEGKTCCLVTISPSPVPVYLKEEEKEECFIRLGIGTTSLRFSEASAYINSRFTARLL